MKAVGDDDPNEEIHFISNKDHGFEKVFEKFNVQWFDMESYDSNPTYELEKFKKNVPPRYVNDLEYLVSKLTETI